MADRLSSGSVKHEAFLYRAGDPERAGDPVHHDGVGSEPAADSGERLRTVIATAPDAYVGIDLAGRVLDWNRRAEALFGWTRHEMLGRPLLETIIPEGDRAAHREGFERYLRTGESPIFGSRLEVTGVRRDATVIPIELTVWPVESATGVTFSAFIRDIGERVGAQEQLRQSEERFRKLVELAPEGIAIHDGGRIVVANPAFAAMFDVDLGRIQGMAFSDLASEEFHNLLVERDRDDAEDILVAEVMRHDGTLIVVEIRGRRVLLDGRWCRAITLRDLTAERQAEGEARQATEQFRIAMHHAPIGMALISPDGQWLEVNDSLREMLGYEKEEQLSLGFRGLTHPDDLSVGEEQIRQLWRGEIRSFQMEKRYLHADGHAVLGRVSVSLVRDAEGHVQHFISQIEDITERRRIDQEIEDLAARTTASEELYRAVAASLPDTVLLVLDNDLRHRIASGGGLEAAGYRREEIEGRTLAEVAGPERSKLLEPRYRAALGGERLTWDAVTDAGRRFEVETVPLDEGRDGVLVVGHDVTQRRIAEEALTSSEERFRSLAASAPIGIFHADADNRCTYVNGRWEDIFGLTQKQAVGHGWLDGLHAEDRARIFQDWSEVDHDDEFDAQFRVLRPDGTYRWVHVRAARTHTGAGELTGYVGSVEDITDRIRADEAATRHAAQLADSNRELEQFAYIASHDLKEPLRAVAGYTQLLSRRYRGQLDAEADEFIDFAVQGAKRMQALIDDLLAYAQVGNEDRRLEPIDLAEVIEEVLANLSVFIADSDAVVTVATDGEDLPTFDAVRGQIVRLLQNLVGNALKFAGDEAPRVEISAQRRHDAVEIRVRDHGIGVEPRFTDRIFAMFQRLHSREEFAGTGIGLAICRKIVEMHGGRIWADGHPGDGTSFCFTLPDREGCP
jgi:PAS domain S-box-containing protein